MHYPSLDSCNAARDGYMQAGNQVSQCIDRTVIDAFKKGFKEEMQKPIVEGQDV